MIEHWARLVKECTPCQSSGCGLNEVFHPDYNHETKTHWMDSVVFVDTELSRLRAENGENRRLLEAEVALHETTRATADRLCTEIERLKGRVDELGNHALASQRAAREMGHTPGPWSFDREITYVNSPGEQERHGGLEVVEENGEQVTIASVNDFFDAATGYANARLIASAPDLFAALCDLVNEPQPLGIDRPAYQRALKLLS